MIETIFVLCCLKTVVMERMNSEFSTVNQNYLYTKIREGLIIKKQENFEHFPK